jgi:hypothetical protein
MHQLYADSRHRFILVYSPKITVAICRLLLSNLYTKHVCLRASVWGLSRAFRSLHRLQNMYVSCARVYKAAVRGRERSGAFIGYEIRLFLCACVQGVCKRLVAFMCYEARMFYARQCVWSLYACTRAFKSFHMHPKTHVLCACGRGLCMRGCNHSQCCVKNWYAWQNAVGRLDKVFCFCAIFVRRCTP